MANGQRVLLLVGTRKGAFIFESDASRQDWRASGPHFPGWSVQHMKFDPRSDYLYVALDHLVYGSNIHRSIDAGRSWEMVAAPAFSAEDERTVRRVWHVQPGHASQLPVLYAGVDPGALFRSTDGGKSWRGVEGLNNHETRHKWQPGAGGMMVHTVIQDPRQPERLFVAISAAGVFCSEDWGHSWQPRNRGTLADFLPENYPEVGQCCHHLVMSPTDPDVLYQQNHCGVYRTRDGGRSWADIGNGLPATFGFPIAIHPRHGDTIYVVPQRSNEFRYTPKDKFRVYRSRTGGDSWEALTAGLPQENAYLNVFREGLATDDLDPAGVYVGTGTGELFYSRDEGDTWQVLSHTLPPVYSVGTAVIG